MSINNSLSNSKPSTKIKYKNSTEKLGILNNRTKCSRLQWTSLECQVQMFITVTLMGVLKVNLKNRTSEEARWYNPTTQINLVSRHFSYRGKIVRNCKILIVYNLKIYNNRTTVRVNQKRKNRRKKDKESFKEQIKNILKTRRKCVEWRLMRLNK